MIAASIRNTNLFDKEEVPVLRGGLFFLFTQRKVTLLLHACGRQDTFLISNAQRRSKKEDWGKLGPNIIHYLT